MKPKTHLWISKLILRVSYFKMILLILYICVFSIIDAGKPSCWTPKCCSFEKWPKSQVFIFHTQNPRNYDYPDCFGTLLTPSLVLTIASCFKECVYCTGFFLLENTVSIVKVRTNLPIYYCIIDFRELFNQSEHFDKQTRLILVDENMIKNLGLRIRIIMWYRRSSAYAVF